MILQSFRHLWGVETPLPQFIPTLRAAGYTGVETGLGGADKPQLAELLTANQLQFIPMVFTAGSTPLEHLDSLKRQVDEVAAFSVPPRLINSHSGSDTFSFAQSVEFFRGALELEKQCGIAIGHETHRGRVLYNPWITRDLLRELPELKLTADFSHWVCVCERLLGDCAEEIALAAQHSIHVHCRVGHEEGPQVSDPRAPEWTPHLTAHENWWSQIWAAQRAKGLAESTFTPEFGPPGYMPTLPYTKQPVASLPEICDWIAQRQHARFAKEG